MCSGCSGDYAGDFDDFEDDRDDAVEYDLAANASFPIATGAGGAEQGMAPEADLASLPNLDEGDWEVFVGAEHILEIRLTRAPELPGFQQSPGASARNYQTSSAGECWGRPALPIRFVYAGLAAVAKALGATWKDLG